LPARGPRAARRSAVAGGVDVRGQVAVKLRLEHKLGLLQGADRDKHVAEVILHALAGPVLLLRKVGQIGNRELDSLQKLRRYRVHLPVPGELGQIEHGPVVGCPPVDAAHVSNVVEAGDVEANLAVQEADRLGIAVYDYVPELRSAAQKMAADLEELLSNI